MDPSAERPPKKGQKITLTIDSVALKGKGVARHGGYVLFVPDTVPGDVVEVVVTRRKSSFGEAHVVQLLTPSPIRMTPKCRHAQDCGGCVWQPIPYAQQAHYKESQVCDTLQRIGFLSPELVHPILSAPEEFEYRNKMEFSFGTRRWLSQQEIEDAAGSPLQRDGVFAGLHAPGRFDRIIDLQECHLQAPIAWQMLDHVRSWCRSNGVSAYSSVEHQGDIRTMMTRLGRNTGQVMVNLSWAVDDRAMQDGLTQDLLARFPSITTLVHTLNTTRGPSNAGCPERIVHGPGYIEEILLDRRFRVRPQTFFQTNTRQAEALFTVAREMVMETCVARDSFMDLYCGVGSITLSLCDLFQRSIGVDVVEESIRFANENRNLNGISNVEFLSLDSKEFLSGDVARTQWSTPDVLVVDPPRAGLHPDVVAAINTMKVPVFVYISCEPSTLARDLHLLSQDYSVEKVQPVDMFPQTYHIESVSLLTRRGA